MKKLFALISLLMCIQLSYADENNSSIIGLYKWNESIVVTPCDLEGKVRLQGTGRNGTKSITKIATKAGQKFRVIAVTSDGEAIIQFLDYTKERRDTTANKDLKKKYEAKADFFKFNFYGSQEDYDDLSGEEVSSRNYGVHQAYFKIEGYKVQQFASKEGRLGHSLAVGVINFPFKYRPQTGKGDFSGAFNFGVGIGYKLPHNLNNKFSITLLSGYSISNIVLDNVSVGKNQASLTNTNNFTAFTFSLGLMIEYQSVQAGIFVGWDRLSRGIHNQFDWHYQGKPWVSVGFGLAIFSSENSISNHAAENK
jgi:hypothetical protein